MNHSAKARFVANKAVASKWRDLVVSNVFAEAADAALLSYLEEAVKESDGNARIAGAHGFLNALRNIAETAPSPPARKPQNLTHTR